MWIDYTIQRPRYGEVVFLEYADSDAQIRFDHFLFTPSTELLDIIRWKVRDLTPTHGKLPAN